MKYELFFLNNIHDSMEMVNVEVALFQDLPCQYTAGMEKWEGNVLSNDFLVEYG